MSKEHSSGIDRLYHETRAPYKTVKVEDDRPRYWWYELPEQLPQYQWRPKNLAEAEEEATRTASETTRYGPLSTVGWDTVLELLIHRSGILPHPALAIREKYGEPLDEHDLDPVKREHSERIVETAMHLQNDPSQVDIQRFLADVIGKEETQAYMEAVNEYRAAVRRVADAFRTGGRL